MSLKEKEVQIALGLLNVYVIKAPNVQNSSRWNSKRYPSLIMCKKIVAKNGEDALKIYLDNEWQEWQIDGGKYGKTAHLGITKDYFYSRMSSCWAEKV